MRHLLAAYDLSTNKLYGHIKVKKAGPSSWPFCATCDRSILLGSHRRRARQLQPHLSTKTDARVGEWASANNVELAYTPHSASWLNRIQAQFTALRHFCLDGTDHDSHKAQAFLIRRYIAWRNQHTQHRMLPEVVKRANVA